MINDYLSFGAMYVAEVSHRILQSHIEPLSFFSVHHRDGLRFSHSSIVVSFYAAHISPLATLTPLRPIGTRDLASTPAGFQL